MDLGGYGFIRAEKLSQIHVDPDASSGQLTKAQQARERTASAKLLAFV